MNVSEWVRTRISQIESLSKSDGGGENTAEIDSNEEFSCLAKLLANCTEEKDKKFVNQKMQNYLKSAKKSHFEKKDGTSYDEVYDSTGNRMYVGYDLKGNLVDINTTRTNKKGIEVPVERISFNKNGSIFIQDKDV